MFAIYDHLLQLESCSSLAALGLVENNAPNIVAAMLVSPLMGPVMSITFGAIISDRELMVSACICSFCYWYGYCCFSEVCQNLIDSLL